MLRHSVTPHFGSGTAVGVEYDADSRLQVHRLNSSVDLVANLTHCNHSRDGVIVRQNHRDARRIDRSVGFRINGLDRVRNVERRRKNVDVVTVANYDAQRRRSCACVIAEVVPDGWRRRLDEQAIDGEAELSGSRGIGTTCEEVHPPQVGPWVPVGDHAPTRILGERQIHVKRLRGTGRP